MNDSFEEKNLKFQQEKKILVLELENALKADPDNWPLQSALRILTIKNSTLDLNNFFNRLVREHRERFPDQLGEKLMKFEIRFLDYSDNLKSIELKQFAKQLCNEGYAIVDYGMYWSKMTANWLYIDRDFDVRKQKEVRGFSDNIEITEHFDKLGGFKGFYDKTTDEAVVYTLSNLT